MLFMSLIPIHKGHAGPRILSSFTCPQLQLDDRAAPQSHTQQSMNPMTDMTADGDAGPSSSNINPTGLQAPTAMDAPAARGVPAHNQTADADKFPRMDASTPVQSAGGFSAGQASFTSRADAAAPRGSQDNDLLLPEVGNVRIHNPSMRIVVHNPIYVQESSTLPGQAL